MSANKRMTRMNTGKTIEDETVKSADVTLSKDRRIVRYSPKKTVESKKTKAKGTSKSAKGLTWIPCFRSNLHSISSILTEVDLRESHLNRLKISPFFNLFNSINSNKDVNLRKMDSTIEDLIKCYKPKERKFLLGKVLVGLSASDVTSIFGVVSGSELIDMKKKRDRHSLGIVERLFPNCKANEITMKKVKENLRRLVSSEREVDIGDVVRLLNLIALGSVFFASKGEVMSPGFLYYVDDLERMKSYDWSSAIVDNLLQSLDEKYKSPILVVGCVSILPYWFNEHTKVMNATRNLLPRCMKWEVSKKIANFKDFIKNLRSDQVRVEELALTDEEKLLLMDKPNEDGKDNDFEMSVENPGTGKRIGGEDEGGGTNLQDLMDNFELILGTNLTPTDKGQGSGTNELIELRSENESLKLEKAKLLEKIKEFELKTNNAIEEGHVFLAAEVEMRRTFDDALKVKDREIEKLKSLLEEKDREIKNLEEKLAEKDKDSLQKKPKCDEEKGMDIVAVRDQDKKIDTIGSMERRVKERGDKRKRKVDPDYTYDGKKKRPQVSNMEGKKKKEKEELVGSKSVLDVNELEDRNVFLPTFNENFSLTTKSMDDDTKRKFTDLCRKLARPDSVWYISGLHVAMWQLWELAHDMMTEAAVMDAYLNILRDKYKKLPPPSGGRQRSKVNFVSSFATQWLKDKNSGEIQKGINEVIKQFADDETIYILFPIHSSRNDRGVRCNDHWTLLVLDTENGEYKFYNSMKRIKGKDYYATHGKLMFDHVRALYKRIEETQKDVDTFIDLKRGDIPQQRDDSLDCGIIVLMEAEEMFDKGVISKTYEADAVSKYRVKMIHDILASPHCPHH